MSYVALNPIKSRELSSCKSFKEQSNWLSVNYPLLEVYKIMYATYPNETKVKYYATDYTKDMLAQEIKIHESKLTRMKYV
tara:strand:- start:774 stop:1013 length:240 start_codon:yes stop_codon:yes gene_type:complete